MSRFNKPGARPAQFSPLTATAQPGVRTFEGATGYARDAKTELFLLGVSNFGKKAFYETAEARDERFEALVRALALDDPRWLLGFLGWLRGEGNMRTAAMVGAAEAVKARLDAGVKEAGRGSQLTPEGREVPQRAFGRLVVDAVCQRADEPGEFLAYWTQKYGRRIPKPVKRGLADAVVRLYNEYSLLKYDTGSHGYRFADVIDLVHPKTPKAWQDALFTHALDRRHHHADTIPDALTMIHRRGLLVDDGAPEDWLNPEVIHAAGLTWEAALSAVGSKVDKARLWEALIPSMPYMALLRNLRNFDEAGLPDHVAERVMARLRDPEQVARSRQFPFRFWSAYRAVASLRWGYPLEKALGASLENIPQLPGRTLVLVDRSPSMFPRQFYSTPNTTQYQDVSLADQAALFGSAIALRCEKATLVEFGLQSRQLQVPRAGSVLKMVQTFGQIEGTSIPNALQAHYTDHDRVVILTDEQTRPGYVNRPTFNGRFFQGNEEVKLADLVPAKAPIYVWNFGGYKPGAVPAGSGRIHCFGGLSDAAFRMVSQLEAGYDAKWPWLDGTTRPAARDGRYAHTARPSDLAP